MNGQGPLTTTTKRTQARPRPATQPQVPLTFAQVRERIKRPRVVVDMVMDAEANAEIDALEELLERAQRHDEVAGTTTAPDVAKRLQEVEGLAEASRVRFTLEAVTHRAYQRLRADHPPTKEQIEQAAKAGSREEPAFDADAFAPALVRAQLLEPKPAEPVSGEPDEFAEFWDALSDGQLGRLWNAALSIQFQSGELGPPSVAAAEVLRSFGLSTD
ncbi:MAG: hypothetical protein JWO67_1961 [Streptosporangiaceae bacterium]|nr:hypothetical protein [Streptosporangiaceae bacterium]